MVVIQLTGIVRDGSGGLVPTSQRIAWVQGEDGEIWLDLKKADGTVFDPTAVAVSLHLAVRPKNTTGQDDGRPLVAREGTDADAVLGRVKFSIASSATLQMAPRKTYRYDVNLTVSGARQQVVPVSDFRLEPIVSMPGDPSSAP